MFNKSLLALALGSTATLVAMTAQAVPVVTFADNTSPTATSGLTGYTAAFGAGKEFRMIDPGTLQPGGGGEKSLMNGGGTEMWSFDATNTLVSTAGFPGNPGATSAPGSAAPSPNTNPTLNQNAPFFGQPFNFLAPTTTSLAGTAYGPAVMTGTVPGFDVLFPVMEAQWGGTWFPLHNVTLNCTVTGSNFNCFGEHIINSATEDPGHAGFGGWRAQWNLVGTIQGLPPVPEASTYAMMLAGLGLVGFATRRRKHA